MISRTIIKDRVWYHFGWNWKRIALGLTIDKWGLNLDLGPFWFGVEW
jgi:hypothetical protein